jgi:hypothetical protein
LDFGGCPGSHRRFRTISPFCLVERYILPSSGRRFRRFCRLISLFAYVGPLFCLRQVVVLSRFDLIILDSVFAYVGPLFWSRSIGELPFGETLVWALWTFVGVLDSVFAFVRPSSWGPGPYFSHPPTLRNRTTRPPASAQGVALKPSEAGRFQR